MTKLKALQCNYSVKFSQCCCRSPTSVTKAYFHRDYDFTVALPRVLQEGSLKATFHSMQIIKEKGTRAISHAFHFKCSHPLQADFLGYSSILIFLFNFYGCSRRECNFEVTEALPVA